MKHIKKILPVFAIFIAMLGTITVFATSYTTMLQLGAGYHTTGAARTYTAGTPAMQFTLKYFIKHNNQNYSRMQYKIMGEDNRVFWDDKTALPESIIGQNQVLIPNVRLAQGKYKWYYSTKVDGTTYSGFYMNPVTLYTL